MSLSTTQLTYIGSHAQLALDELLSVYKGKPRIEALVKALAEGAQVLEDDLMDILVSGTLDLALGDVLDKWGELVGEQRGTLDDLWYRRFVQARIQVNISTGTPDELIRIYRTVTDPVEVRYREMFPAGFKLYALRQDALPDEVARRVSRIMADAKPMAITMMLVESVIGYFGWIEDSSSSPFDGGTWSRSL